MKRYLIVSISFLCIPYSIIAEPIISVPLQPYPIDTNKAQRSIDKLKNPKNIAKQKITGTLGNNTTGIFATYAGYLQVSNFNGQINFPRKHTKPFLYIIITPKITPIVMFENTLSHWNLESNTPAKLFTAQIQEDKETGLSFWDIKKTNRPRDNKIPLESITIIAKPKNIYIPTGISLSKAGPNLLLPTIYVKKEVDITKNALYILNIAHYFGPIYSLYKKETKSYSTLLSD